MLFPERWWWGNLCKPSPSLGFACQKRQKLCWHKCIPGALCSSLLFCHHLPRELLNMLIVASHHTIAILRYKMCASLLRKGDKSFRWKCKILFLSVFLISLSSLEVKNSPVLVINRKMLAYNSDWNMGAFDKKQRKKMGQFWNVGCVYLLRVPIISIACTASVV